MSYMFLTETPVVSFLESISEQKISLEHCKKVLQNNPIEKELDQWVQIEYNIHECMMKDNKDKDDSIEKEFDEVFNIFKKKDKPFIV